MKKELFSVWKEGRVWKVQFPKGILSFPTKKEAQRIADGFRTDPNEQEVNDMDIPKRTKPDWWRTDPGFITCPDDVFHIIIQTGCISNSITLQLVNQRRQENVRFSLPNKPEAWDILKKLDDMGGRKVQVCYIDHDGGKSYQLFKESIAYKCRFK
jgi:hypothetical protein